MAWLTSLAAPTLVVEGQIYGSTKEVWSKHASVAGIRAGLVCQRGATRDLAAPLAVLPAAAPTSILDAAPGATAVVAGQTIEDVAGAPGGILDGAIGFRRIFPPRRLTYTFNANANWGLAALGFTTCHTIGLDADGRYQVETWNLPAGGGVVVTTDRTWSQHLQTLIGPCDGAGGGSTLTIGTAAAGRVLGKLDYGIAAYEAAKEPSATATVTFDVGQALDFVKDGVVGVINETTTGYAVAEGDPVAVRIVTVATDVRGQMTRWDSALEQSGNFALLSGAYWASAAAAGAPALVRIGG